MGVECPASMMERALGERGFGDFQRERGQAEVYRLTSVQTDAILRMTLGQLAGLEQERLTEEHSSLLNEIEEYLTILSDQRNMYNIIKEELTDIARRFGDDRRTEINGEEVGDFDMEKLITETNMVVTISHRGYIKRLPTSTYRAQKRGGKGIAGAKTEEEDPIQHLFVASTHAYLLYFTNQGKVYWQKVWEIPELSRESKGRAIVNLLNLAPDEKILDCVPVRDFNLPGHFMTMATKKGLVKKTPLEAYSRPKKGGIIAIKLKDGDELVDVVITKPNDQLVLATAGGMAIRFMEQDVRPTGRNTSGVRGVRLKKDDVLVGMVVADPTATLLTVCANGYGKRTNFGPGDEIQPLPETPATGDEEVDELADAPEPEVEVEEESDDASSSGRYRTQRRGGKGVIDIKTTKRNGPVVGITRDEDSDELIMMTVRGKIQRVLASDISIIGRNTQGVRIMSLDESDALMALVRVPSEDVPEVDIVPAPSTVNLPTPPASPEVENNEDANPSDDANGQTE